MRSEISQTGKESNYTDYDFPGGTVVKTCNIVDAENAGLIPGWRRSHGVGNDSPL